MVKKKASKKKANKSSNNFNKNLLIGVVVIILLFVFAYYAGGYAGYGEVNEEGLASEGMLDIEDNEKTDSYYIIWFTGKEKGISWCPPCEKFENSGIWTRFENKYENECRNMQIMDVSKSDFNSMRKKWGFVAVPHIMIYRKNCKGKLEVFASIPSKKMFKDNKADGTALESALKKLECKKCPKEEGAGEVIGEGMEEDMEDGMEEEEII